MSICFCCNGSSLQHNEIKNNKAEVFLPLINNNQKFKLHMLETLCSDELPCCIISSIPFAFNI